jgi:hypothetical protein
MQWTDTWMKIRNGKWPCIASNSAPINVSNSQHSLKAAISIGVVVVAS